VSGNPTEMGCLLKLITGTEPDTIQFEDQLREIKMLTTRLPLPQLHTAPHTIRYPTHMENLRTCSYCPPCSEQSISTQTRQSFPHQTAAWAAQVLPGADTLPPRILAAIFSPSPQGCGGLPAPTASHTLQPAPSKLAANSESDDAQRKAQFFFLQNCLCQK